MSRGEVLANSIFISNYKLILDKLEKMANELGLMAHFNISTIMPKEVKYINFKEFLSGDYNITIFYSLYSTDMIFRKKWLPKAIDPIIALDKLKEWQNNTGKLIALHWAYIKNENDSLEETKKIVKLINNYDLNCKFNLVRYNPYSINQGVESEDEVLNENFEILKIGLRNKNSRIVPKVGFDVKASCGMFINYK
jgi:adenine C2-methylase RlmN of 23S rRNA A2503 and tRNA A37